MNGKQAKHLRRLVAANEPILLMTIHQHFGEKTKSMNYAQIYKAAKKVYKMGELDDLFEATRGIRDLTVLRRG